jgi:hypothetical protein
MLSLLVASSLGCSALAPDEARSLVLLTPKVASVESWHGSDVAVRLMRIEAGQYLFRASSGGRPGADLIGWYSVDPLTYVIRNWVADGKPIQRSPEISALQARLHDAHCPKWRSVSAWARVAG